MENWGEGSWSEWLCPSAQHWAPRLTHHRTFTGFAAEVPRVRLEADADRSLGDGTGVDGIGFPFSVSGRTGKENQAALRPWPDTAPVPLF